MNNNQGKQIMLSVIGVLVLVITIIGVTFAFFTYSRTGASNNVITAGKVTFTFADGQYITLTDQFPISNDTGIALTGTGNICTFTITGNTVSGTGSQIKYSVWAIPGDTATAAGLANTYTTRLADSQVSVNIQSDTVANTTFTHGTGLTASTGAAVSNLATSLSGYGTRPTNGKLLGYGTITGTGANITRSFTVRMWINTSVTVCASGCSYTETTYQTTYYTMKIAVVAEQ